MYLTALTHRDRLFETAARWLIGEVHPDDARFVTEVFLLDHMISRPVLIDFLSYLIGGDHRTEVARVRTKDELRRMMMQAWLRPTARGLELFSSYEQHSDRFFPMTPLDGFVLVEPELEMFTTLRFKSLTRIVEKAARRAYGRIRAEARKLAGDDAVASEESSSELEQQVCERIEDGRLAFEHDDMTVQDVIGVKLVAPECRIDWIEWVISAHEQCTVVGRQEHHGRYNDRQFLVRLPIPPVAVTVDRLRSFDWSAATSRGIDPDALRRAIPEYVESASRSISIEIILTNWEDYVESEFGRSIHEERVVRQRSLTVPGSHATTSIALGLLYLLLVAVSPRTDVTEMPIRLSGRYLPETTVGMITQLFGFEIATSPFWTDGADPGERVTLSPSFQQPALRMEQP